MTQRGFAASPPKRASFHRDWASPPLDRDAAAGARTSRQRTPSMCTSISCTKEPSRRRDRPPATIQGFGHCPACAEQQPRPERRPGSSRIWSSAITNPAASPGGDHGLSGLSSRSFVLPTPTRQRHHRLHRPREVISLALWARFRRRPVVTNRVTYLHRGEVS